MRNKKVARLTESQLHNIIAESVKSVLKEEDGGGYGLLNPSPKEELRALEDAINTVDELIDVLGVRAEKDRKGNVIIDKFDAVRYCRMLNFVVMSFLNGVKNRIS